MSDNPVLYWIRNDLRLADNPALRAAVASAQPVVPVFIWSPEEEGRWAPGAASRAWLGNSLASLAADYERHGLRLVLRRGNVAALLLALCEETGAARVHASCRYDPPGRDQETRVRDALSGAGVELRLYNGSLLNAPDDVATQAGEPYKVFTPYYRACMNREPHRDPYPAPESVLAPKRWPESDTLASLDLIGDHPWVEKMRGHWAIGEAAALRKLESFAEDTVADYPDNRDLPGVEGTSSLSPHLHFGELSPLQVWHAVCAGRVHRGESVLVGESYLRQLYWREFAHHLLYYYPETPEEPLKKLFAPFPWAGDGASLARWQRGQTGYPFVDAGMRELWETGWMHNRVRMAAASFLVKDLRIHWREGAEWFWDTLVDADLANNTLGWQWVAGCGADAAPYFRVFNPVTQGRKFDSDGAYVRRWVPELAALPDRYLHRPWEMPPVELAACGVQLGKDYPLPMVDHAEARKAALGIYDALKGLAG